MGNFHLGGGGPRFPARQFTAILILGALCFFVGLGDRMLWNPMEPRYAGIVASMMHATPRDAESAGSWLALAFLVLPFYSVLVSYRGVRTLFEVTRWKARLWFLALPLAVYGAAIAAMLGLVLATMLGGL